MKRQKRKEKKIKNNSWQSYENRFTITHGGFLVLDNWKRQSHPQGGIIDAGNYDFKFCFLF